MRYFQLIKGLFFIPCFFVSCAKEGTNCPNCPRGTTGTRGNIVFFTKTSCEGGSAFTVLVDDSIAVPVMFSTSVPDCSTPGVSPVSLKTGNHQWKASCSSQENVLSGVINVSANGCMVKELR